MLSEYGQINYKQKMQKQQITKMGSNQGVVSNNTQDILSEGFKRGLYQITPINKTLNRTILGMAYTPGVGAVCKEIQKKPELVDELTLRGRSVAIITQGKCFSEPLEPGRMPYILDWCVAQIKYYSNVDSFPFIIRPSANLNSVIKDLSNTYSVILILDLNPQIDEADLPKDVTVIKQEHIAKLTCKDIVTCENTSRVLAYALHHKIKGLAKQQLYEEGLKYRFATFKKESTYFMLYRDGRSTGQKSIDFHRKFQGKVHIQLNFQNIAQLRKHFTQQNLLNFVKNTQVTSGYQNISAIVTDGTAILGFGDIGPKAGLPVMQGKSLLFKVLGGVNVVPICVNKRQKYEETVQAILDVASYFKAINLEDIKAPDCFFIQRTLQAKKILPVFHDDQHGTSIVTLAALINALKVANKKIEDLKIIISGVGAAGITICKLFLQHGAKNIIMADTKGAIFEGRTQNMNGQKQKLAKITNPQKIQGKMSEIIKDADVFIGVSGPNSLKKQDVKKMKQKPIIFALANPDPEITLDDALEGGAFIYGSGRSDFKNQINNSLVFPGIFRGIHEHNLPQITDQIKQFVAVLIAQNIDRKPTQKHIIVDSLDLDMPILISNGLAKFKVNNKETKQNEAAKL